MTKAEAVQHLESGAVECIDKIASFSGAGRYRAIIRTTAGGTLSGVGHSPLAAIARAHGQNLAGADPDPVAKALVAGRNAGGGPHHAERTADRED